MCCVGWGVKLYSLTRSIAACTRTLRLEFAAWPTSLRPPGADRLSLRWPNVNSRIWLSAVDISTINIILCIIIIIIIINFITTILLLLLSSLLLWTHTGARCEVKRHTVRRFLSKKKSGLNIAVWAIGSAKYVTFSPLLTYWAGACAVVYTESCPVGSYEEDGECVPCPLGFYQDSDASVRCQQCPEGRNTTFTAARNVTECKRMYIASFRAISESESEFLYSISLWNNHLPIRYCHRQSGSTAYRLQARAAPTGPGLRLTAMPALICRLG